MSAEQTFLHNNTGCFSASQQSMHVPLHATFLGSLNRIMDRSSRICNCLDYLFIFHKTGLEWSTCLLKLQTIPILTIVNSTKATKVYLHKQLRLPWWHFRFFFFHFLAYQIRLWNRGTKQNQFRVCRFTWSKGHIKHLTPLLISTAFALASQGVGNK